MTTETRTLRYRLDPALSRFTVQAFAGGLLSFLAHSPTFSVRDFRGELWLDGDALASGGIDITVRADSLRLEDNVRPADRQEIEGRMRQEVLQSDVYPEIRFQSQEVSGARAGDNQYRLRIGGQLTLRGVTRTLRTEVTMAVFSDGVRLRGAFPLRLSDFGIRPVTAAAGAIKLQDQLQVTFDLAALPAEGP